MTRTWEHTCPLFGCSDEADLTDGRLCEDAVTVFTMGHCHSLALALYGLVDCDLVGVFDERGHIAHVAVEISDGVYLDAHGLHDCESYLTLQMSDTVRRVTAEDIEGWVASWYLRAMRVEEALPFAVALCEANGVETRVAVAA